MARKKATVVTKKTGTVKTAPVKAETVKKTEPMKTSTTEKTTAKIAEEKQEVKAEVKAEVKPEVKVKPEAKPETKPSVETKAPAKKAPVKKAAAKKDIKVKAVVEYYGKQVEEKDMIAAVKKAWTKSGRKIADIKTIDLYIKPEEGAVYYVINGIDTGAVAF